MVAILSERPLSSKLDFTLFNMLRVLYVPTMLYIRLYNICYISVFQFCIND